MSDETERDVGDAIPPPPSRRPKKKEPTTIRIQSGKPIPPGHVDFVPPGRTGRPGLDARALALIGLAVAAFLIILLVLLTRGDDDPEPTAAASPTAPAADAQDRFIARGDALCKRANRARERLLYPGSPEEFPGYLEENRAILVRLIGDLRDLRRPSADRRLLKRMFVQLDRLPPLLTEAQEAAASGDTAAIEEIIGRGERIEHRANALALQYGFVECSQP